MSTHKHTHTHTHTHRTSIQMWLSACTYMKQMYTFVWICAHIVIKDRLTHMLETHQGVNYSGRPAVISTDYEQTAGVKECLYAHCHRHSLSLSLSLSLLDTHPRTHTHTHTHTHIHTHLPFDGQWLCWLTKVKNKYFFKFLTIAAFVAVADLKEEMTMMEDL